MEFADQIALVTGASRGLGRAVAQALGARGAKVIAVARTVGGLEELDDAIRVAGGPVALLVPLDIADGEGLARLGMAVHERCGRLDLWVHTAIHAPMLSPVEHIEPDDMERTLAVDVAAVQRLIRVVDPLLRQAPAGRAVFVCDEMASDGFNAAYRIGKAGQLLLAEAWGRGLAKTSAVRLIQALAPPMPTALRARWFPGEDRNVLTPPDVVATRLIEALAAGALGEVDLRSPNAVIRAQAGI